MVFTHKTPLYRADDNELLGFVGQDSTHFLALTIFGYQIARTDTRSEAENILREKGLSFLMGVWQYYDTEDRDWFPCVIKEAYEQRVIVERTNALGYLDPDDRKHVVIKNPTENTLVKSA